MAFSLFSASLRAAVVSAVSVPVSVSAAVLRPALRRSISTAGAGAGTGAASWGGGVVVVPLVHDAVVLVSSPPAGAPLVSQIRCSSSSSSTSTTSTPAVPTPPAAVPTNGKYLNYAMLHHDSVAFLLSNQLGIPEYIANDTSTTKTNNGDTSKQTRTGDTKTPAQVAAKFNLSLRAASALLVTLCRLDVVQIVIDSPDSVDDIVYELTPTATTFLSDQNSTCNFTPFADTFTTHFITPEALLECSLDHGHGHGHGHVEKKDIMSEHLEQKDEDVATNARHFMKHMNAQSYCCAKALPIATGLNNININTTNANGNGNGNTSTDTKLKPTILLDIGGGSAIYTIEAVKSNPNINGIVFELPAIKPITEEYINKAGLQNRISVTSGDFFTEEPFPGPVDVVLFSNVLHDWPDEINLKLIAKAYDCLGPGGRIVISELLLSDDVKSSSSSATSMNVIMLPFTKGRQYRPKELFGRLERAGFVDPHVVHLVDDYDLVIATKV